MTRIVVFLLAMLVATPAHAITCEEVRAYVAQYGKAKALAFALKNGATLAEIREARKCLSR